MYARNRIATSALRQIGQGTCMEGLRLAQGQRNGERLPSTLPRSSAAPDGCNAVARIDGKRKAVAK